MTTESKKPKSEQGKQAYTMTIITVVITVLVIGSAVYSIFRLNTNRKLVAPLPPTASGQIMSRTYVNKEYGFTISYPSNWSEISDASFIDVKGNKVPYVALQSPVRHDFPNYQKSGVVFELALNLSNKKVQTDAADFMKVFEAGDNGAIFMNTPQQQLTDTQEFKTAQQIIQTVTFP
jgi:flagellar basal body-associated protein FliL